MVDIAEFDALVLRASHKRDHLMRLAERRRKWRRHLIVFSGIIALISGGAITAVISNLTDSMTIKVLSASLAFASGLTSLFLGTYFDDKETQKMYEGAARYLEFRDRAKRAVMKPLSPAAAYETFAKLQEEYAKLAKDYDPLGALIEDYDFTLPGGGTVKISAWSLNTPPLGNPFRK
jgi:hypothetical protein